MSTVTISKSEYSALLRTAFAVEITQILLREKYPDTNMIKTVLGMASGVPPFVDPEDGSEGWHE